jgi:hypothetical protein
LSIDYAERARALVGTRFRLQGRSAEGLDCVGVAVATYGIDGVRSDYRLRGDHVEKVRARLSEDFHSVPATELRSSDLMLMQVSNDQVHLAVRTDLGFVHAHARLRRVVETPGMPEWPLVGVYRKRRR